MAKQAFLCKYAEIGIKGKNRYKFENALCEQIRRRLAKIDGEFTVVREQGRIFVEADGDYDFEDAIDAMSQCLVYPASVRSMSSKRKIGIN